MLAKVEAIKLLERAHEFVGDHLQYEFKLTTEDTNALSYVYGEIKKFNESHNVDLYKELDSNDNFYIILHGYLEDFYCDNHKSMAYDDVIKHFKERSKEVEESKEVDEMIKSSEKSPDTNLLQSQQQPPHDHRKRSNL